MEEPCVATFNPLLLFIVLAIVVVAALSIGYARGEPGKRSTRIGRWVFTISLIILGGLAIAAALLQADALAPLGLLSGMLVVGMVWETPEPQKSTTL
jgi:hypothetical protein